ncbi:MAG: hypothetical protein ACOC34_05860 [Thermotogota bacterium]
MNRRFIRLEYEFASKTTGFIFEVENHEPIDLTQKINEIIDELTLQRKYIKTVELLEIVE